MTVTTDPFFHADTEAVRFCVRVDGQAVGAGISQSRLHFCFRPTSVGEDPLDTDAANVRLIEEAVRRRGGASAKARWSR